MFEGSKRLATGYRAATAAAAAATPAVFLMGNGNAKCVTFALGKRLSMKKALSASMEANYIVIVIAFIFS